MTLVKWNEPKTTRYPGVFGGSLSPVFNDFFDDFFGGRSLSGVLSSKAPAVNISEDKDSYQLELAAPGLKKDDFKLNVENDVLTITVERQEEKDQKEKGYTRREFNYTNLSRAFTLPDSVNADAIKAAYKDGVLEINLPKREEEKTKTRVIEIA